MVTCPKCKTENPDNVMNCKSCHINLSFALSHPEQSGLEKMKEQKGKEAIESRTTMEEQSLKKLGKKRNAGGVIFLMLITLGIYFPVWFYKINKEIKHHDPNQKFSPGWSTFGMFIPIANLVAAYNTADRIKKMQKADGNQDLISPGAALVWLILFCIGYPIVVQGALNNHWDEHEKISTPMPATRSEKEK